MPPRLSAFAGTRAANAEATVMGTFVTHDAPLFPHDLTCRTCAPVVAMTLALKPVPLKIIVLLLLSSE